MTRDNLNSLNLRQRLGRNVSQDRTKGLNNNFDYNKNKTRALIPKNVVKLSEWKWDINLIQIYL